MKHNLFTKCRPHRIYINGLPSKAYVSVNKAKKLVVSSDDKFIQSSLKTLINNKLGNNPGELDLDFLSGILDSIPQSEIFGTSDKALDNVVNFVTKGKKQYTRDYSELKNTKTPQMLFAESEHLEVSTAPMKASTSKNVSLIVDHREPDRLFNLLQQSKLNSVDVAQLKLGDILATDGHNELIIERKTITDFYQSVTGDEGHAHDQTERYHEYQQQQLREGKHVKIIWIVESEDNGSRMLYNGLTHVKNVDGYINYLSCISDQYIINTFGLNHTAYMTMKLVQGFFERQLIYPKRIGGRGARIDKKHPLTLGPIEENHERGVIKNSKSTAHGLSMIHGIKTNVAKELAGAGKSIRDVALMSVDELCEIKGISTKSAETIFNTFNRVDI